MDLVRIISIAVGVIIGNLIYGLIFKKCEITEKENIQAEIADREEQTLKLNKEFVSLKFDLGAARIKMYTARELISRLYNAGRDVLMYNSENMKAEALKRLEDVINDKSIEQVLKELEEV